jgi:hypothetical protein
MKNRSETVAMVAMPGHRGVDLPGSPGGLSTTPGMTTISAAVLHP